MVMLTSRGAVVCVLVTVWVEWAKLATDFLACDCMGCGTSFARLRDPERPVRRLRGVV
jgi:hypothetical protein